MLTSLGQGSYFANQAQQFQNGLGVWRPGLNGVENGVFRSETGSGFGELGGTSLRGRLKKEVEEGERFPQRHLLRFRLISQHKTGTRPLLFNIQHVMLLDKLLALSNPVCTLQNGFLPS